MGDPVASMLTKLHGFADSLTSAEREALGVLMRPGIEISLGHEADEVAGFAMTMWTPDLLADGLRDWMRREATCDGGL
jgi:hypothetical protein